MASCIHQVYSNEAEGTLTYMKVHCFSSGEMGKKRLLALAVVLISLVFDQVFNVNTGLPYLLAFTLQRVQFSKCLASTLMVNKPIHKLVNFSLKHLLGFWLFIAIWVIFAYHVVFGWCGTLGGQF